MIRTYTVTTTSIDPGTNLVTVEFVENGVKLQSTGWPLPITLTAQQFTSTLASKAQDFWTFRDSVKPVYTATGTHRPGRYAYTENGKTYVFDVTESEARSLYQRAIKRKGTLGYVPDGVTTHTVSDLPA